MQTAAEAARVVEARAAAEAKTPKMQRPVSPTKIRPVVINY